MILLGFGSNYKSPPDGLTGHRLGDFNDSREGNPNIENQTIIGFHLKSNHHEKDPFTFDADLIH